MKSAIIMSQHAHRRLLQRNCRSATTLPQSVAGGPPTIPSTRAYRVSHMRMDNISSKGTSKRPRVHASGGNVEGVWYTSKGARPSSLEMGRYGLSRLNYATMEPPVWTVPPHPPTKSVMERVLFPLTIVLTGAVVLWAYMNPEEDDMREYWKRVETGAILVEDDDDDDEDWDDDEEQD